MHEACPPPSSADIIANMTASTVAQYLAALPADRRAALSAVRKAINENLPDGYEEGMHSSVRESTRGQSVNLAQMLGHLDRSHDSQTDSTSNPPGYWIAINFEVCWLLSGR